MKGATRKWYGRVGRFLVTFKIVGDLGISCPLVARLLWFQLSNEGWSLIEGCPF